MQSMNLKQMEGKGRGIF